MEPPTTITSVNVLAYTSEASLNNITDSDILIHFQKYCLVYLGAIHASHIDISL